MKANEDARMAEEAARLAEMYNWPNEASELRRTGKFPAGFGHTVGVTIAMFLHRFPFGKTEEEDRRDRSDAKQLARLRLLVGKINFKKRRGGK